MSRCFVKLVDPHAEAGSTTAWPTCDAPLVMLVLFILSVAIRMKRGAFACSVGAFFDWAFQRVDVPIDSCFFRCIDQRLPVFHDGVKRWPCCMQEAWDWDEFLKLKGKYRLFCFLCCYW